MAYPMTLTVYGPVTPLSPNVRVTGVLAGAEATILDNGSPIGSATATANGELRVPVATPPTLGHTITATQKTADGTSEPSPLPITVVDVPDPLSVPVIISALNTCMADILARALVPGATVVTTIGGQLFGKKVVGAETELLVINPTQPILAGSQVQVHQEAIVGGVARVGNPTTPQNIPAFTISVNELPPPVLAPLVQCATDRTFIKTIPGARTTITNEGYWESWLNLGESFSGPGGPPLRLSAATAIQEMPRLGRPGQMATFTVAPATTPGAPVCAQGLCPEARRLSVSGLAPGGVLHVERHVLEANGSRSSNIGDLGIQYETQPIDLPSDVSLTDPNGEVVIALKQDRCDGVSPVTLVHVAAPAASSGPPTIVGPLLDCSQGIPIVGAHVGAIVQAFEATLPLSDPVSVSQVSLLVATWFPLQAGNTVHVRQWGCNADGDSAPVTVDGLPVPIPDPTIVAPVRPGAALIAVNGVLPGARLYLMVNDQLRPGSVDCYQTMGSVPVTGVPLAAGDRVFVVQALCDQSSNQQGRGVDVTRGKLDVSVSPTMPVTRGTTTMVTVFAADADSGTPVTAPVLLNGHPVGSTGVPFAYAPNAGDPNPMGLVQGGAAYNDAAFSITLVDPRWNITLIATPVPVFLGTVRIEIQKVVWTVSPDYPAVAKTVTVTPIPPTANAVANLARPTGATKTVTVTITGTWTTNGGDLNGTTVPAQSGSLVSDTHKVAFTSGDEAIAWLIFPTIDPISEVITVKPKFQSITP